MNIKYSKPLVLVFIGFMIGVFFQFLISGLSMTDTATIIVFIGLISFMTVDHVTSFEDPEDQASEASSKVQ